VVGAQRIYRAIERFVRFNNPVERHSLEHLNGRRLLAKYEQERQGAVTADTWSQNRIIVRLFIEFVGETSHVSAVTRKAVRDWKHKLAKWPGVSPGAANFRPCVASGGVTSGSEGVPDQLPASRSRGRSSSSIFDRCKRWQRSRYAGDPFAMSSLSHRITSSAASAIKAVTDRQMLPQIAQVYLATFPIELCGIPA
jgi:hypothetical protein